MLNSGDIKPIGMVKTGEKDIPGHWTVSGAEGKLVLEKEYEKGLQDIAEAQRIVVIFLFHKSPLFSSDYLIQNPPHSGGKPKGVFSICSPVRPNPIGLSVLDVLKVESNVIFVRGIDMLDGTPILDIKPHFEAGGNDGKKPRPG